MNTTNLLSNKKLKLLFMSLFFVVTSASAQTAFEFSTAKRGPLISPLQYGIFYEEINHAGDGGIYAELVRNGSMEENGSNPDHWQTIGGATQSIYNDKLLNGAQKHAMRLKLSKRNDGVRNNGFWGINIQKGLIYKASFWMRADNNWTGDITLTLENSVGGDLGHTVVSVSETGEWKKYTAQITSTNSNNLGWFAIRGSKAGTIYLDCVSLFPPTFNDRENGMRPDLAQMLADLHPRFMRFPGGCFIEGGNRYQWKHTIGPVENRLGIYNSHWGYPISNGMGFHEFLQLSEDLGAEPLFVCNVGLGHGWYENYQSIDGYIQEALDAIEYCNGDVTTFWGAKRAEAGHPEPFNLSLLEIGNENYNYTSNGNNDQSDHYAERYKQFYDAIKAKYPEMTLIGNSDWGSDYPTWRNQHPLEIIDEHFYRSPDWFAGMYHKYDNYSRSSNKVYNGEYAVTSDFGINGTLKAALGEAIYMAGMERNSDVCVMASYAPIFMNENEAQWRPDMIHYNAYKCFGTPSYWVQQMMSSTLGHQNITWTETGNDNDILHTQLALGSWGTDVTYSNIKVTDEEGKVVFSQEGDVNSSSSNHGISRIINTDTYNSTVEMDAVKNSGDEGFLIAFAYADANNYTWWNLGGWGNSSHGVEQSVNGSKTTLTTASGTIETGRSYHVKIVRNGLRAQLYLDGKIISTATLNDDAGQRLFLCASVNEKEDTAILKVVNYLPQNVPTTFVFSDATIGGEAQLTVMSNNDNYAENSMTNPTKVCPRNSVLSSFTDKQLTYDVPAYSLSVIQIPLTDVKDEQPDPTDNNLPQPVVCYSFEDGKPTDDNQEFDGTLNGPACILRLDDGNQAFYTGEMPKNGFLDLGNNAAKAIARLLNGNAHTVSVNIMAADGGNLDKFCWAWTVNSGTGNYAGLINQPNNLNWYYERVGNASQKASTNAGLSQHTWHNITVTAGDEELAIYIDGKQRGTAKKQTSTLSTSSSAKAWLARSPFAADAYMTSTFFDDFRVYDQKLTPEQVKALYVETSQKSTACKALIQETENQLNETAVKLIGDGAKADLTSMLVNPDFAKGGTGWDGTTFSAAPGTVAEHYYKLFDTYQILHNMPAGLYRLTWQGFYRDGNIANAYLRHQLGQGHSAEIYANETATDIMSLYDENESYTYSPYNYPDNVATAQEAFQSGHYLQQMDFKLAETADLRIGMRNFVPTVYDWLCVDNFSLLYLGDATGIGSIIAPDRLPENAVYDLSGRRVTSAQMHKGIYIVGGQKVLVK